jgi:hypothetical protein
LRAKFGGCDPRFGLPEVPRVLQRAWGIVFFYVSAIDGIPQALVSDPYGANGDYVACHFDCAAGVLKKRPVPTVSFHAPRPNEHAIVHRNKPDTDESVLALAGSDAETFGLSQYR